MKAMMPVEFNGFSTPNFVQASFPKLADGSVDYRPLPLSAIPDDVFHMLVSEWVKEVYEKAQKQQPPTAA